MSRNLREGGRRPARMILPRHRFRRGLACGPVVLSPRMSAPERDMITRWLSALPAELATRMAGVKIASAPDLETPSRDAAHAAAFIPHRYLLLGDPLFSRPAELGRILYHELCHFAWPRLAKGRHEYEAALRSEIEAGAQGELGYSAELARRAVRFGSKAVLNGSTPAQRAWRHYLCESFCDTGAFVLLRAAGHRRRHHSEWTLEARFIGTRVDAWWRALRA